MVQGGYAHAGHGCEFFDAQGFGIVEAEPLDCFGGAVALLAERGDGAEMLSLRGMEQAVDDFALDQVAEEWNVLRGVEKVHEAGTCVEEFDGGGAYGHSARFGGFFAQRKFLLAEDLADGRHLEAED